MESTHGDDDQEVAGETRRGAVAGAAQTKPPWRSAISSSSSPPPASATTSYNCAVITIAKGTSTIPRNPGASRPSIPDPDRPLVPR